MAEIEVASALADLPLICPAGYTFSRRAVREYPKDLFDCLLVWELPRKQHLYVVSVDVGDGIGKDRSVVDVTRMGTLKEPDEQVAQFVSAWTDPMDLAVVTDAIGRLYTGADGQEALCAIECNNHGYTTQNELQRHLGYTNFFIWQVMDAIDVEHSYMKRIGWVTTQRTRPMILARYLKKVKTVDKRGVPDYRINSPHTIQELRSFRTVDGIRDAEADPTDPNAHDDCIMTGAIGLQVIALQQYETEEPLDMARRRLTEERARQERVAAGSKRDFQNTDCTVDEMHSWATGGGAGDLMYGSYEYESGGGRQDGE